MDFTNEKYDIIIEAGQSNSEGCGRGHVSEEYVRDGDICYLVNGLKSEVRIEDGREVLLLHYEDKPPHIEIADEREDANGKIGDFALTFAKRYKSEGLLAAGRRILIVRAGVGGTGFMKKHWGLSDVVYLKMIEMIDYALGLGPDNRIVAFLWHQGEHDAFERNDPDNYAQQLKTLIDSVKARYGLPALPFVSGDFVREWKGENIDICAPIVEKIKEVTTSVGGAFVETADLPSNNEATGNGDGIHFCRESLRILGERYFEAYRGLKV